MLEVDSHCEKDVAVGGVDGALTGIKDTNPYENKHLYFHTGGSRSVLSFDLSLSLFIYV